MTVKERVTGALQKVLEEFGLADVSATVDYPADPKHGDYSSNVALIAAHKLGKNPVELAEDIAKKLRGLDSKVIEKIEVVKPGFINFWIRDALLAEAMHKEDLAMRTSLSGKKILIEYAHPNTHKEMHIGHMRTLITGEGVARLLEAGGATVFRANYQGDIGPHVAKALYGIEKIMQEKGLQLPEIASWSNKDKAHFLGKGYARGNEDYEEQKEKIDRITKALYERKSEVMDLYKTTRQWSLDYYDEFYGRFYTKFDKLFFESDMADAGKKRVEEHIGKVFRKENGAVIFPGEEYGLHTRVFITQAGNPTYEGKEMENAFQEYATFPFDKKIHVVANEQIGYFKVVFKALELIDPEKFKEKQFHLSMGMVQLKDRKMSSRTGDVLTVDWLLDQIKERIKAMAAEGRISSTDKEKTIEQIVIGAVKYSVLKVVTTQDAAFDIETSVSLQGNSGPYIQYTYARTQSVLRKSESSGFSLSGAQAESKGERSLAFDFAQAKINLESEERQLLRLLARFPEIVQEAADRLSPNIVCTYLFEVAQAFNLFYQTCPILKAEAEVQQLRLSLTAGTGLVLKEGLSLLGIKAPKKM